LQPEPGVFQQIALGAVDHLPKALGTVAGGLLGPLGFLAAPVGGFMGQLLRRAATNHNCIVANGGVELQSPMDAPWNHNFGSHNLYDQEHPKLDRVSQYRVQFDVYRV
jgi:hypothetical protein